MAAVSVDAALEGAFAWALWKVLDYLSAKYLPGSLLDSPQRAGSAAFQAAADEGGPSAAPRSGNPALSLDAALAALKDIDPGELQAALASLKDDGSPLVQSLAWALGAADLSPAERQQRLDTALARLNKAEAFALLAVLLWQAQAGQPS
jgi:hypothetical protein